MCIKIAEWSGPKPPFCCIYSLKDYYLGDYDVVPEKILLDFFSVKEIVFTDFP